MLLLLHGDAGAWDELVIALAAVVVLWLAVRLAGRKPADADESDESDAEPSPPPATPLG